MTTTKQQRKSPARRPPRISIEPSEWIPNFGYPTKRYKEKPRKANPVRKNEVHPPSTARIHPPPQQAKKLSEHQRKRTPFKTATQQSKRARERPSHSFKHQNATSTKPPPKRTRGQQQVKAALQPGFKDNKGEAEQQLPFGWKLRLSAQIVAPLAQEFADQMSGFRKNRRSRDYVYCTTDTASPQDEKRLEQQTKRLIALWDS